MILGIIWGNASLLLFIPAIFFAIEAVAERFLHRDTVESGLFLFVVGFLLSALGTGLYFRYAPGADWRFLLAGLPLFTWIILMNCIIPAIKSELNLRRLNKQAYRN